MRRNRIKNCTLKDVFKTLYSITETHESSEGETIEDLIDVSTLGLNNSGDVERYEDDYIVLDFEKGDGSTSPKYYNEGGYRFYNNNRIFISTKKNVKLQEIRFIASSNKYQADFDYISGTQFSAKDVNYNTAVTTIVYNNEEVTNSYFVITNATGDNTQSRIPSFSYIVEVGETKEEVTAVYDENINRLYPITRIIEDDFSNTPFNVKDEYIDELFIHLYAEYSDWYVFLYQEDISEQWEKWITIFLDRFFRTKDRYETLLEVYKQEQDSLLSQLKSSRSISNQGESENRLNDTPQVQDDGTIEGDDYLTQYQKGNQKQTQEEVSSFDPMTAMARLTEIGNQYRQVWSDWLDEFKTLFYPSQMYDYAGVDEDDD